MLAYSSISQMGVIAAAFGMALASADQNAATNVAFYAANHVLVKAALFLSVGAVAAFDGRRFDGVHTVFCGTSTLTPALYAKARALFGPVVRITYGKSEVVNPITVLPAAACATTQSRISCAPLPVRGNASVRNLASDLSSPFWKCLMQA